MKTLLTFIGLVVLLAPGTAWSQSQLTTTFEQRVNTENYVEFQLIRCDESASIAGTGPVGGDDDCVSGSWTRAVSARDYKNLKVQFYEYGGGSAIAKVWNCVHVPGGPAASPSTTGGSVPGTEAPGGTPSAADPDPLCVSLDDSAGVSLVGTAATVQELNISNQVLHYIVGEIDDCTGNCDSTLNLSLGR